jgi:hypothetical protein
MKTTWGPSVVPMTRVDTPVETPETARHQTAYGMLTPRF